MEHPAIGAHGIPPYTGGRQLPGSYHAHNAHIISCKDFQQVKDEILIDNQGILMHIDLVCRRCFCHALIVAAAHGLCPCDRDKLRFHAIRQPQLLHVQQCFCIKLRLVYAGDKGNPRPGTNFYTAQVRLRLGEKRLRAALLPCRHHLKILPVQIHLLHLLQKLPPELLLLTTGRSLPGRQTPQKAVGMHGHLLDKGSQIGRKNKILPAQLPHQGQIFPALPVQPDAVLQTPQENSQLLPDGRRIHAL